VFGRVTDEDYVSPGIESFAEGLNRFPYRGSESVHLNPAIFVPRLEGFWAYDGSDTVPPCTEDVKWLVMHHAVNVTVDTLTGITQLVNDVYHGGNSRTAASSDSSRKVALFPNPSTRGEGGGEMLMMAQASPLSSFERRVINATKKLNRSFEAFAEPTVIDMARAYLAHTNNSHTAKLSAEDWLALEVGVTKFGAEPEPGRPFFANVLDRHAILGSVDQKNYTLILTCPVEYAWDNRFISPSAAQDAQNGIAPVIPAVFVPPESPPGAEWLEDRRPVQMSLTPKHVKFWHMSGEQSSKTVLPVLRPFRARMK